MAAPPVFFSHPSSLQHETGDHPEGVGRMRALNAELERCGWLGWERCASPAVAIEVLRRVHAPAYIESIERVCAAGGGALDADTWTSPGSYEAALRAAGGAVALVERLVQGGAGSVGFSAHRPPGHHALPARAMGFCLFNNIAVAARHAVAGLGLQRVLVLDWDVHHGNGTNDIFSADRAVLFCSIHQLPLYPGTGGPRDLGSGDARGYTVNLPVRPGSGDDVYVSLVRDVVVPLGRLFEPELVLVSAGYDAHRDDPLASCEVTEAGFAAMTQLVCDLGAELGVPVGAVLEGGYDVAALSRSVVATMEVLSAGGPGGVGGPGGAGGPGGPVLDAPRAGSADEALARLREFWPGL